jgi:hypothetical protein
MKRWLTTTLAVLVCSAALRADVTIVQTTTVEGGMASMAAQAGGRTLSPTITTRIKGLKGRTDADNGTISVSTIIDLATRQLIVLHPDQKTATVVAAPVLVVGAAGTTTTTGTTTGGTTTGTPPPTITLPKIDSSVTPTGKSQVIDGIKCDEFTFNTKMNMGEMTGSQMPPEAAAMMQGMMLMMQGSIWVAKDAPGLADYTAFQKAAASGDMAAATLGASGINIPGMDKLMKAMSSVQGLAYLTEMTINIEGTGQIAEMMRQMGPMKVTSKVSSVKAEALADDLFKVPEGYTVVKQ